MPIHLHNPAAVAPHPTTSVLLDKVILRFVEPIHLGLTEPNAIPADGHPLLPLLRSLSEDGLCEEPSPVLPSRIRQRINMLVDVPAGGQVRVGGELTFSFIGQMGWSVSANSQLWCNGMELLRSRLPNGGDRLGRSLDGSTNWIGPADDSWQTLSRSQADGLAHALSLAWSRLRGRLGLHSDVNPLVALRDVEACHDIARADAIPLVVALHGTYPHGTRHVAQTFYAESQTNRLSSEGASVRWTSTKGEEFALKAYAKRRDLLRLEVAASKGRGVRRVLEAVAQDHTRAVRLSPGSFADLLRRFLAGAAVHVSALRGHVAEVRDDPSLSAELIEGLAPLLSLRGKPEASRPGAPITPATLGLVRDAWTELLRTGGVRPLTPAGKLVPKGHPVRDALESMSRPGGVVVFRPGYRRWFTLQPRFSGARCRLSQTLLPTLPAHVRQMLAAE